jgi:ATP-dependent exoDNAse (exonuclease V) beta subunit
MFEHHLFDKTEIEAVYEDGKRYYLTPNGEKYPSVTTKIGEAFGTYHLDQWRKRVGEEEAERISNIAKRRGTAIHSLCEAYIMNDPKYTKGHMPVNVATFKQIQPVLDEYVTKVYGIEFPLWSSNLKTAGRCDLIADFDGKMSIVDYKTSKRRKDEDHILNYFVQATTYAHMLSERLNIAVPEQIAIVIAVDEDNSQLFMRKTSDYVDMMYSIFGGRSNESIYHRQSGEHK